MIECAKNLTCLTVLCALAAALAATGCGPPATGGDDEDAVRGATHHQEALDATEIVAAPETGIDLGWGWNSQESLSAELSGSGWGARG